MGALKWGLKATLWNLCLIVYNCALCGLLGHRCRGKFQGQKIGVSETGSAKTGSTIDVRIDDAGSILNFRIGFSLWLSAVVSQLRPSCPIGFEGIGGRYWISVSGSYRPSIRGRLPYPCLPTLFPILREKVPQRTRATKILLNFRVNLLVRFASKRLFYWVVPSKSSDNSLVLFVRFFGFGFSFGPEIVGNRGQLWTSALSPHLLSPHLDFPDTCDVFTHYFFVALPWPSPRS